MAPTPVKPTWPPVKAKRTAKKVTKKAIAKTAIKKANGAARPRSK
jgi:hypothetical protein